MRKTIESQGRLDLCTIPELELNFGCRDEIVQILRGLQHVHSNPPMRNYILELVANDVNERSNRESGRPGMDYWQILVLAAIRNGCNLDFDKLHDMTENHRSLRIMLQLSEYDRPVWSTWRAIEENLMLLKPETVEKISHAIVELGHDIVPKAIHKVRLDSFVVRTNIHYPSESSLINDGLQHLLNYGGEIARISGIRGWRQQFSLSSKVNVLDRRIARACSRKGPNYVDRSRRMYARLLKYARRITNKTRRLLDQLHELATAQNHPGTSRLREFLQMTEQVCETTRRRVLKEEVVPNSEKLFSMYEQHTQLYKRGKAGEPVQFGRLVAVAEDAAGFIVGHWLYKRDEQDRDEFKDRARDLQQRFDHKIEELSTDRGFYSPDNERSLAPEFPVLCMPRLGSMQGARQLQEAGARFREARRRHPGIESAIGALQAGNGLDRCRDRTERGFERYVAYGIMARNLQVLGKLLIAREAPESEAAHSDRRHKPAA